MAPSLADETWPARAAGACAFAAWAKQNAAKAAVKMDKRVLICTSQSRRVQIGNSFPVDAAPQSYNGGRYGKDGLSSCETHHGSACRAVDDGVWKSSTHPTIRYMSPSEVRQLN